MAAAARLPLEVDHAHSLWQEGQLGTSEYHLVSGVKRSSDALCWWVGSKMCAIDGSFNIFVISGDARGRVFSWSVAEQPGRGMADHWLKDEAAEQCVGCHIRWDHKSFIKKQQWHRVFSQRFSIYERRHHCRNCGLVFCSKCSRFESEISRLRLLKPVRVCQNCYTHLKSSSSSSSFDN